MKLTSKGNYAISAMLDLAIHSSNEHISLGQIAKRLDISENYLRQLFMILVKEGLVKSIRGVGGGYILGKSPAFIHVLDIVEAVEGKINIVPCLVDEDGNICARETQCSAKLVWESLNDSVKEGLYKLTLQDLIEEYEIRDE